MTGMCGPNINGINTANVWVGDTQANSIQHGALTFDMPPFPSGFGTVLAAEVCADQTVVSGSPYSVLGVVHIFDVEYATPFQAESASALADIGVFSANGVLERKCIDVTTTLVHDQRVANATTQFRLEFGTGTNGDDTLDRVGFNKPTVSLGLSYLAE